VTSLGLIESPEATYDGPGGPQPQLRLYYMHSLGHGVGLDVHDPNLSPFDEGSAFTIEPGIYVRGDVFDFLPDTERNRAMIQRLRPALERYRDIGVRIEDTYLVTGNGVERVSAGAPREIAEIEAMLARERHRRDRQPGVVDWYPATTP
jgi:Xaa-Pro aminopeptidase